MCLGSKSGRVEYLEMTTTYESVSVVRPLKVIALCSLIIAVVLLIACLATTNWLKAGDFRAGLFVECTLASGQSRAIVLNVQNSPPGAPAPASCHTTRFRGKIYIQATAALLIIAGFITAIGVIMTILGLTTSYWTRKYMFYRVAMYMALIAVLFEVIALVVFPICFYIELKDWGMPHWEFDWSYGLSWGVAIFTFGASILLCCDKEEQEIYYKDSTVVYTSGSRV